MVKINILVFLLILISACNSNNTKEEVSSVDSEVKIAFGSCNRLTLENFLWDDIRTSKPDMWIWGGDNIYADTEDVQKISTMYGVLNQVDGYKKLKSEFPVIGTWDDHDYGVNDGGVEFPIKKESQQAFLDFMSVPEEDSRRTREGIYATHDQDIAAGKVKIIVLDTRYFRTALTPDTTAGRRYRPNTYGEGTILGESQWIWLEEQLRSSNADFNLIVSSIQFLSKEHGFECWGNFPHEVDKLKALIVDSSAKGVLILSGDRHISEFSKEDINGLPYPLIDFTSSGLTHAYDDFIGEPNQYRIGDVVAKESFGLLRFNLKSKQAHLQMVGNNGKILQELQQQY